MTRRNQSQRRRTYGRRQHEVRERRDDSRPDGAWAGEADTEFDTDWQTNETNDRTAYEESYGGFGR